MSKKIIFYNTYHVGDTFFSQAFIQNIIDSTPTKHEYYIYAQYNTYMYTETMNIFDTKDHPEMHERTVSHIRDTPVDTNNFLFCYYEAENVLFINTWIGAMHYYCNKTDHILHRYHNHMNFCNLLSYNTCYTLLVEDIRNQFQIDIQYNNTVDHSSLLPILPPISIDSFFTFREKHSDKKLIVYHNYPPGSQQAVPLRQDEHNALIKEILKTHKDVIILIPHNNEDLLQYKKEVYETRLVFISEEFGFSHDGSCRDVFFTAKIGFHSDLTIYYDIGRSFTYICKTLIDDYLSGIVPTSNKRIHFGNCQYHFNVFNNRIFVPENYVNFIYANSYKQIVSIIDNNIRESTTL